MTQSEFIERALYKPWQNRACSWDAMDCWGVVIMYYRHVLGIEIPVTHGYSNGECSIIDGVNQQLENFDKIERPTGDAIVFLAFEGDEPTHVGVMISKTKMIHARGSEETGGTVSIHSLRAMMNRYPRIEFYKYRGLNA